MQPRALVFPDPELLGDKVGDLLAPTSHGSLWAYMKDGIARIVISIPILNLDVRRLSLEV